MHAGSLVAALASWLDARAHHGQWLVRIEDIDTPRCVPGADEAILQQLAAVGLVADEAPVYQSQRNSLYQSALDQLVAGHRAYPCACTRQDIAQALAARGHTRERHEELVYPGTCRHGLQGREARAWRFLTGFSASKVPETQYQSAQPATNSIAIDSPSPSRPTRWHDRRLGAQSQDVSQAVGDFILKRADGLWAYQLAVVVDDAAQGVTHVVRGEDLADNTARQILLQAALGVATPAYLHVPLVTGANGEKLSKQNGATPLDTSQPLACLRAAGEVLQLAMAQAPGDTVSEWLVRAVAGWRDKWVTGIDDARGAASGGLLRRNPA